MNKSIDTVQASKFTWSNNYGKATVAELGLKFLPHRLDVRSDRTGEVKHFSLDQQDPSFEDHWDGELVKLVDANREIFLAVFWEELLGF
jgi:hypothetical protein